MITYHDVDGTQLTEYEAERQFLDEMNDVYGSVKLFGMSYSAIQTLKEVDPIAYREVFLDWLYEREMEEAY